MSRPQFNYVRQKREDPELIRAIIKIKERRPYYGLPRVLATLRRDGFVVNGKRVHRLMRDLRLKLPRKKKAHRLSIAPSRKLPDAISVGDVWAMDFVFDRLADQTSFRCLTIIDLLSREAKGIYASHRMAHFSVVDYLDELKVRVELPKHLILDNGPEFKNLTFIEWCHQHSITCHFIDPGKPVQNAYIESFNGKFRNEFLSQHKFKSLQSLRERLASWLEYYNCERPHSSLDYLTPKEFADQEQAVLEKKINSLVLKTG